MTVHFNSGVRDHVWTKSSPCARCAKKMEVSGGPHCYPVIWRLTPFYSSNWTNKVVVFKGTSLFVKMHRPTRWSVRYVAIWILNLPPLGEVSHCSESVPCLYMWSRGVPSPPTISCWRLLAALWMLCGVTGRMTSFRWVPPRMLLLGWPPVAWLGSPLVGSGLLLPMDILL